MAISRLSELPFSNLIFSPPHLLHHLNQVKKLYSSIQIYKIRMLDFLVIIDIGLYARMSFFKLNNSLKFHPAYKPGNSIILYSKYIVTLFREEREGKKTN